MIQEKLNRIEKAPVREYSRVKVTGMIGGYRLSRGLLKFTTPGFFFFFFFGGGGVFIGGIQNKLKFWRRTVLECWPCSSGLPEVEIKINLYCTMNQMKKKINFPLGHVDYLINPFLQSFKAQKFSMGWGVNF